MSAHIVGRFDKVLAEWDVVTSEGTLIAHFHSRFAAERFLAGWKAANDATLPLPY